MKLPTLPFGQKKEKPQYILSLIFRTDKIEAFIFEKFGDEMRIVSEQEEFFQDSLENANYEELLELADKVISQGEDEANIEDEVTRTIFGLKESWISENKIKKEHLDVLKKLCTELGLTPVGFLTISEAIVGLLQKEEGAPPSAVLTDVAKNNLTISLVRAGKVIEVKSSEIHQSAAFTVDTLLKHFENVEILPSRIVLLNEDEELVQEFISHPWSKSLPFLHLPQITNLPSGFLGKAFVLGIAKQMGAKVLDEFATAAPSEEINKTNQEQNIEEEIPQSPEESIENIEKERPNIEYVENDAQEFFGFVEGKDVSKIDQVKPTEDVMETADEEPFTQEIPEEVKEDVSGKQILPAGLLLMIPKVQKALALGVGKIKSLNIKFPKISNLPIKNRRILYAVLPIVVLLLAVVYYFVGLKANVVLSIKPDVTEKSQEITFGSVSDFKNNIIKGDLVSVTEDGSTTTNATGKKQTGDKAKGTVTIFNLTNSTVTYPAQTKITSSTSTSLDFLLDSSVTVASASGDASNLAPGKANVNVTASTFGTQYNLPSGTKYSIGNVSASSIVAKNDNPFSGGTTKDITVVSKDDIQKLQDDLIKNLEDKAKSDIQGKLTSGSQLLSAFVDESVDKKDFDKNVDDEAQNVTLKGTASYTTVSYDKTEFLNYIKNIIGPDKSVEEKNLKLSFDNLKLNKDNSVSAKMNIKAKIFTNVDKVNLAKKISGKSFDEARNELLSIPQILNVDIKFSPNLFFLPKVLPKIYKNIRIEILENA